MNKICETCQKTFWAKENKRRFCSRQCQAVWNGNRQRELWPHKDELPKTYYDAAAELVKARHALQAERERVRVLKDALRVCVETLEEAKFPDWSSPDHCAKISRGVLNMVEAQEPGGVDGGPENGGAVD